MQNEDVGPQLLKMPLKALECKAFLLSASLSLDSDIFHLLFNVVLRKEIKF